MVSLLIKNGADPNSRDNWNFTPLHEAAIKGKVDVCISKSRVYNIVCRRIKEREEKGRGRGRGSEQSAWSHFHSSLFCPVLLQHGADAAIRNSDGKTALDLAEPTAKLVLSGDYKKDDLLEAARTGNEEVLMAIITPLNVNCHADDGRKVLVLVI